MIHHVSPLDAYPDSWRCSCSEIFRSDSGFTICPNSDVKGYVRKFGPNWFHYVSIDGVPSLRGQTDSWAESFKRVFRNVQAIRPAPQRIDIGKTQDRPSYNWPRHHVTWDAASSAHS